jgi:ribose/xylose/arabinose/galactoside ABC-type transport system permease subunit
MLLIILILILIAASFLSDVFFTVTNLLNILRQVSIFGIIAIGLTFVLISGNMDLTVGSIVSLSSVMFIHLQNYSYILAFFVTLITGSIIGFVSGYVVGKLGVNSVITTLAMMLLVQGLAMLYTKGYVVFADRESPLLFIGKGYIYGIPMPIIIFISVAFCSYIILRKTVLGKHIYATGGMEEAARLYGIKTVKTKILVFVISGICCVISSFILGTRLGSAHPEGGAIYLFDALVAVILGGTSLYGGKGHVGNTFIGILIIGVLANLFVLMGIEYYNQLFFKGLIMILAVWIDVRSKREE